MPIITAILLSFYIIEMARLPERFFNRKPLNCMMCLSFWMALVVYLLPVFIQDALLYTSAAGVLSVPISNLLKKLR